MLAFVLYMTHPPWPHFGPYAYWNGYFNSDIIGMLAQCQQKLI